MGCPGTLVYSWFYGVFRKNISHFPHFCGKSKDFQNFITNCLSLGNSGNMSKRKKMCINIGIIVALVLAMVGLIMGTYFAYSIISQFENTAGLGRIRVRIRFG